MEICIALVCTAWVLRYHYRNPAMGKIPKWIRVSISLFSFTSVPVYFLCVYMCLRVCCLLFAYIYFNISVFVHLTVSVSVFLCISFFIPGSVSVVVTVTACMSHAWPIPTVTHVLDFALVLCRGVGVTVVSTLAFDLCDPGSIPAQCSYQIKIPPWSHVRRVFPV